MRTSVQALKKKMVDVDKAAKAKLVQLVSNLPVASLTGLVCPVHTFRSYSQHVLSKYFRQQNVNAIN